MFFVKHTDGATKHASISEELVHRSAKPGSKEHRFHRAQVNGRTFGEGPKELLKFLLISHGFKPVKQ